MQFFLQEHFPNNLHLLLNNQTLLIAEALPLFINYLNLFKMNSKAESRVVGKD
jgi:hypothetical protein